MPYAAGIEATHIPYRGGAEVVSDILGGRVDFYFCPLATALPLIQAGQVRALLVSTPKRVADLPDVFHSRAVCAERAGERHEIHQRSIESGSIF